MSMGLCPTRASRAREPRYYYYYYYYYLNDFTDPIQVNVNVKVNVVTVAISIRQSRFLCPYATLLPTKQLLVVARKIA